MNRMMIAIAAGMFAAGSAQAMPVADFLAKADALQAKGMMALFSSDFRTLRDEAMAGTRAWRAQVAPPGRKPNACPPQGKASITSDDILAMLRTVPPAQRATTSVSDALTAGLNRRYPCHD